MCAWRSRVHIKHFVLNVSLLKAVFISLFYFAIYKMVDSEYNMDVYKSIEVSTGTLMRNPKMLKLVPDYLKTKINV